MSEQREISSEEEHAHDSAASSSKSGKRKISFVSRMERAEAVAYFEAIVDGLRSGHVEFRQGGDDLELSIGEQVEVSVKAAKKGDKEKVSFTLEWREGAPTGLTIVPS